MHSHVHISYQGCILPQALRHLSLPNMGPALTLPPMRTGPIHELHANVPAAEITTTRANRALDYSDPHHRLSQEDHHSHPSSPCLART
jgi:hypothetical protein